MTHQTQHDAGRRNHTAEHDFEPLCTLRVTETYQGDFVLFVSAITYLHCIIIIRATLALGIRFRVRLRAYQNFSRFHRILSYQRFLSENSPTVCN